MRRGLSKLNSVVFEAYDQTLLKPGRHIFQVSASAATYACGLIRMQTCGVGHRKSLERR